MISHRDPERRDIAKLLSLAAAKGKQPAGEGGWPLARADDSFFTTKPGTPAAGLGRSAVYGIVKQVGDWVSVYTEKGAGSDIEIFLPCSDRA